MALSGYVARLREKMEHELLELPSVTAVIRDPKGRILLGRRAGTDIWLMPGGAVEPEETPANAAVREVWEETGLQVRLEGIAGVYGGSECTVRYENGDRNSYMMVVFEARPVGGELRADGDEIAELRYFELERIRELPLASWVPELLQDLARADGAPGFRPPDWAPPDSGS